MPLWPAKSTSASPSGWLSMSKRRAGSAATVSADQGASTQAIANKHSSGARLEWAMRGQRELERAAVRRARSRADAAAVRLNDGAADRQPKPHAAAARG